MPLYTKLFCAFIYKVWEPFKKFQLVAFYISGLSRGWKKNSKQKQKATLFYHFMFYISTRSYKKPR